MKRNLLIACGVLLGLLVLCFIALVPAASLWQKMGLEPFCFTGSFPNLKIVDCLQAAQIVTPMPLPTSDGAPIPLIVDDDGSPDGMIALLFFLSNPQFDVRAVTVSYGEAHPAVFAPQVAKLLAGLGRAGIPVGAGSETPLAGSNAFPDSWRQASDSF